jgi:tetratricopeptide (TPR) repeat protein
MQYDLRNTLGKLGHLEMMGAINARIMKYYEDHPPEEGDVDALRERGVALLGQGDLTLAQGDLAGALESYQSELATRDKLAKQDPANLGWQFDLATAHGRIGIVLEVQGKLPEALAEYRAYQD